MQATYRPPIAQPTGPLKSLSTTYLSATASLDNFFFYTRTPTTLDYAASSPQTAQDCNRRQQGCWYVVACPTCSVAAIVDAAETGKSSLTVQFVENHFVESYYPTIENTFSRTIKFKGQEYTTEIIDTAGQVCRPTPACHVNV